MIMKDKKDSSQKKTILENKIFQIVGSPVRTLKIDQTDKLKLELVIKSHIYKTIKKY